MGHGSNDKLYITHTEHSVLGSHSASSGFKAKQEAPHPGARTPFDCCALSFQPFENPVCARNPDGTGIVFDLINIIPWLKQHDNTNPITKEPLTPADLIQLHYSRKPSGEIHDPISFKPFSEHSHIVAIATTGNVFLAESIKGGKDLVDDVSFKKQDVITLQNPHGLPSASVPSKNVASSVQPTKAAVKPVPPPSQVAAVKAKETTPWNISPYSSGLPGASLTSTSVDPSVAGGAASKLVWDEEELMFEAISNPPKGKGKEKDVGKRRAYVRVVTSLGGGSLNLELFCEKAPKTCYNFLMLARAGKYDNCLFHRLIPGFMIQTGDPTGTGSGGHSYWETPFRDEYDLKGAAKHDSRGVVAMANKGANTNGSQFYLTFKPTPHLDKKHTVFGKLVGGEDVLTALENLPRKDGSERPAKSVKITEVIIYHDPFEEYKTRLTAKLAKRAEGPKNTQPAKKEGDDINWFGVKVGSEVPANDKIVSGGVGKYLNLKRPQSTSAVSEEPSKKRKLGFGNFDGW
ncbi:cyclophilin-like domain-containing protein [Lentinula raphanica]|uniref:RING-type E3 ubiquitin transferase n=1 Tax=Lentinula raphanica TaxID=153919 RepID=A0AA38PKA5_9AGAR|nr:peptidylprolyl isomerase-like protein 2 [Lentinula raphanica]KAJ3829773.1 cyclophilin-like domain-containing protein [Lentinula raphanica]KAJ3844286.1 cyclophilin-like domain-containing protein [Lentinula raphanica]KAJ3975546.1 cyclophilin-like domain-containing protein [Lentinula raphanica]